jgi:hypothetical protein
LQTIKIHGTDAADIDVTIADAAGVVNGYYRSIVYQKQRLYPIAVNGVWG